MRRTVIHCFAKFVFTHLSNCGRGGGWWWLRRFWMKRHLGAFPFPPPTGDAPRLAWRAHARDGVPSMGALAPPRACAIRVRRGTEKKEVGK